MKFFQCVVLLLLLVSNSDGKLKTNHTNNWAVLVDASRFWFNYRHVTNVLTMYRSVRRLGIPDSHIILMIADDMACNPRNPYPGHIFNHPNRQMDVYDDDVEVDYRGYEVTVGNFLRVLTGRTPKDTPRSKRLLSDAGSNVFVYLTGHGGNGFLKFQDFEEIINRELADAVEQMWQKRRYHELLFIVDSCRAATLCDNFMSPNVIAIASSLAGEDSLAHHVDPLIGVHMIDRYTFHAMEFLEKLERNSTKTINDLLQVCPRKICHSTVNVQKFFYPRDPGEVPITDFFGATYDIEVTTGRINVQLHDEEFFRQDEADKVATQPHVEEIYEYESQFPMHLFF